ncbi:YybH family protein [Shewanella surugensis]|uniref:Nuclear transport factor 2 family protein n=1 Tax=Shewanella surugensis TaxID=212020 RepID=A0ABT0LBM6_9GAMM|nr:nuclear transport factor 2 family protein [Shewanella surugensis]MCL1125103.1 nuclear transport factor 2 family protein [Shewanella surugensis]
MKYLYLILISLGLTACNNLSTHSQDQAEAQVRAASLSWIQHFNEGDARYLANAYTVDATMNARPMGEFVGREAIYQFWAPFIASGASDLVYKDTKFNVIDSHTVLVSSNWKMNVGEGIITEEKWAKQADGVWRLAYDDFTVTKQY